MRFFLLLMLIGCAKYHGGGIIDNEVLPYYSKYIEYKILYRGTAKTKNVHIQIVDIDLPDAYATCTSSGEYRYISIDRAIWNKFTEISKEIIILHEMGHCDLDKPHTYGLSIMHPQLIFDNTYLNNKNYLLQELFSD